MTSMYIYLKPAASIVIVRASELEQERNLFLTYKLTMFDRKSIYSWLELT